MPIEIDLENTNHKFVKQNAITIISRGKNYDIYKCGCGVTGKRYGISNNIFLDGRTTRVKARNCPNSVAIKKIKITTCRACGDVFGNLTPGSAHDVVEPPEGHGNDLGVWVMGVGEPVKVLFGEYEEVVHE